MLDCELYLRRLRVQRPKAADAEALRTLHAAHQRRIAFECLDVFRGRPLSLEIDRLQDKLLRRKRGGFCYELNHLFGALLETLGYRVQRLSAGVIDDHGVAGPPFDHLCLEVRTAAGPFLADVGFGRAFAHPLPLIENRIDEDPAGRFRLRTFPGPDDGFGEDGTVWWVEHFQPRDARAGEDGWRPLYRFDRIPRRIEEFLPMFHFHQHSDRSPFPGRFMVTRATPEGRISIVDYTWIQREGDRRRSRRIADDTERRELLHRHFGIELED